MSNQQTTTLGVIGDKKINCGGCEQGIKTSLSQLPGVIAVTPSRESQNIIIESENPVSIQAISNLESLGYQVKLIEIK